MTFLRRVSLFSTPESQLLFFIQISFVHTIVARMKAAFAIASVVEVGRRKDSAGPRKRLVNSPG